MHCRDAGDARKGSEIAILNLVVEFSLFIVNRDLAQEHLIAGSPMRSTGDLFSPIFSWHRPTVSGQCFSLSSFISKIC